MGFHKVLLTLCVFLGSWACAEEPSLFAGRAVAAVQAKGLGALEPFLDDNSLVLLRALPADLLRAPVPGPAPTTTCKVDEPLAPAAQVLVTCDNGTRRLTLVVEEGPDGLHLNLFAPVFQAASGLNDAPEQGANP